MINTSIAQIKWNSRYEIIRGGYKTGQPIESPSRQYYVVLNQLPSPIEFSTLILLKLLPYVD